MATTIDSPLDTTEAVDGAEPVPVLLDRIDATVGGVGEAVDRLHDRDEMVLAGYDDGEMTAFRGSSARRCGVVAARIGHLADRVSVRAAGELVASGGYRHDASTTAARWVERHLGVTRRESQRLVRVSKLLEVMPACAGPFASGEVRLGHLDAIARIVPSRVRGAEREAMWDALRESGGELMGAAAGSDLARFERFCSRVRERLDVDGPADRAAEPSRVWLSEGIAGRWVLSGDLSADDGAILADQLERRTRRLLRSSSTNGLDGSAQDENAVLSEVRADALVGLCRDGAAATAPGRVGLFVHVDLDDLRLDSELPVRASLGSGTDISESTLWDLLADAAVRPVFRDGGQPLSYGRSRRLAPDILREILAFRDRECGLVGCGVPPPWHDAHHIRHWEDGGTTDPAGLKGVCGPHHRGHHQGRWRIGRDAEGDVAVYRPDGTLIDPEPCWARDARRHDPVRARVISRLDEVRRRRRHHRPRAEAPPSGYCAPPRPPPRE